MTHPELTDYEAMAFEQDGTLRTILAPNVDLTAQQRFVDHVCAHYPTRVLCGDEPAVLPALSEVFAATPDDPSWLLSIDLGGLIANCFFRDANTLMADLDPREIETRDAIDRVFAFLAEFSRLAGTSAFLGGEGLMHGSQDVSTVRHDSYFEHSPEFGLRGLQSG